MTQDTVDLLHRHLNGDLDPAEQAAFFRQVADSPELRRALAAAAFDDVLISELAGEARSRRAGPRRAWAGAAAAAALMLAGLWLLLADAGPPATVVVSGSGTRVRDGRPSPLAPGSALREHDRVLGQAELRRGDASLRLDGEAVVEAAGFRLARGVAKVVGKLKVSTIEGDILVSGTAEVVAAKDVRVEVREGTARAGALEIAAGRFGILDGGVREGRIFERARVDAAVARGVAYLRTRHRDLWSPLADGRRHGAAPSRSYTELALLAFRRAGLPADDPVAADLLGRALSRPIESTYIAALQAMALAEIDPAAHRERIRECATLLLQAQALNGQWDYGLAPGPPNGDNSVSAYAALGLRACATAGVPVDRAALDRARRWWVSAQNPDGGWGYNDAVNPPGPGDPARLTGDASYGSATAGALAALAAIADLGRSDPASDLAVRKGRAWLASRFAADRNPEKAPGFAHMHWFAACGRAGRLLRTETFGTREWYPEIAEVLLAAQRPDGAWALEQGDFMARERNEILDTCLAVLFLQR